MDAAARVAGIVDTADLTADPSRDVESNSLYTRERTGSRASLPLASQRSFSRASGRGRTDSGLPGRISSVENHNRPEQGDRDATYGDELPWGPLHPCFPHLNPHVPITSSLYKSTRIIRIKRDWLLAGDLAPTFSTVFPEILDPWMSEENFKDLVIHINQQLIQVFSPWSKRAIFDAGMGLLTGWLWDDLGLTGVKKELTKLERFIQVWNRNNGRANGAIIIPLRRTAYMTLDIQIPDPLLGDEDETATQASQTLSNDHSRTNLGDPGSAYSLVSTGMSYSGQDAPVHVR